MSTTIYQRLLDHYQPQYGRTWKSISCPSCAHVADKSSRAATSMSENGWKCQVCGESGDLWDLAKRCGLADMAVETHRNDSQTRSEQKRLPAQWTRKPQAYLDKFLEHPERLQRWQAYKPLSLEAISRYKLGYGVLPASKCQHPRLIVPLFSNGQIVGFRGRAVRCQCTKWLSSGGSVNTCIGLDDIQTGDRVALIESEVDRILCQERNPAVKMLALPFGVASWQDTWTAELVTRKPQHVLIILDNDLAGNPNTEAYHYGLEQWNRKMDQMLKEGKIKSKAAPQYPNGWKYLKQFRAAGLNADRYIWPNGTPYKYDIGEMFKTTA